MAVGLFGVDGSVGLVLRLVILDNHFRAVCRSFQPFSFRSSSNDFSGEISIFIFLAYTNVCSVAELT